ncbi:hypothetical protein N9A56_03495 [Planktomarina temperata]|nr:hypothetical protein [Planktomarina temperata]
MKIFKLLILKKSKAPYFEQFFSSVAAFLISLIMIRYGSQTVAGNFSLLLMMTQISGGIMHSLCVAPAMSRGGNRIYKLLKYSNYDVLYFGVLISIPMSLLFFLITYGKTDYYVIILAVIFLYVQVCYEAYRRILVLSDDISLLLKISLVYLSIRAFAHIILTMIYNDFIYHVIIDILLCSVALLFYINIRLKKLDHRTVVTLRYVKRLKILILKNRILFYSTCLRWLNGNALVALCYVVSGPATLAGLRALQSLFGFLSLFSVVLEVTGLAQNRIDIYTSFARRIRTYLIKVLVLGGVLTLVLFIGLDEVLINLIDVSTLSLPAVYLMCVISVINLALVPYRAALIVTDQADKLLGVQKICLATTLLTAPLLIYYLNLNGILISLLMSQIIIFFLYLQKIKRVLIHNNQRRK